MVLTAAEISLLDYVGTYRNKRPGQHGGATHMWCLCTSPVQGQVTGQPICNEHQQTSQLANHPIHQPTDHPTNRPTSHPTNRPTNHPTDQPIIQPTNQPSNQQTNHPTNRPTTQPQMQHIYARHVAGMPWNAQCDSNYEPNVDEIVKLAR